MSEAGAVYEPVLPPTLSILPLRGRILLPSSAISLVLTSRRSLALVDHLLSSSNVMPANLYVGVVPLRRDIAVDGGASGEHVARGDDLSADAPLGKHDEHEVMDEEGASDAAAAAVRAQLHNVGTAARIIQITRGHRPMRSYTLLLEGRCRFELDRFAAVAPFLVAHVRQLDSLTHTLGPETGKDPELLAMASSFKEHAHDLVDRLEHRESHARRLKSMLQSAPAHRLADLFVAAFEDGFDARLELLSMTCPKERMKRALGLMESQLQAATVTTDINKRVEGRLNKTQREYLLRQQMQAIREELGEVDGSHEEDDLDNLQAKLHEANPPMEVLKVAEAELRKLKKMTEQAPAYGITRSWIEVLASMPWSKESEAEAVEVAMTEARAVLDEEHYGLDKVKDRIIEYLAVRRLRPEARPPILCFLGPPGVGKTTLARSIAKVMNRPFQRISLGGVRDEADIRGHRRTYIASMPGRLVQGLRRCGVRDPVMLLDELDKMGADSRGDPAAALLEVLDPEQNHAFTDHYVGLPFDLSRVTFLATANDGHTIPGPLMDRMEMIHVPGYTADEKLCIAKQHVVPRVLEEHGLLDPPLLHIPEEAVEAVVRSYTREAGVRDLRRCLASLCRAAAVHAAHGADAAAAAHTPPTPPAVELTIGTDGVPIVTLELIRKVLGPPRYDGNHHLKAHHMPGVVAGLSWTAAGGDLMYVEAAMMPGRGELQLTGQLGAVIKESALIAMSWVQSNAYALGLHPPTPRGNSAGTVSGSVSTPAPEMFAAGPEMSRSVDNVLATGSSEGGAVIPTAAQGLTPSESQSGGHGLLQGRSVHIHLPQGAIPKDGPSAGVTMCTALVSLFSGRPVRHDTAMTGEVSLRGLVLPVGGIKEKLIAAHQNGMTRVLVPAKNMSDVEHEVPAATRAALDIVPCITMADVLANAFEDGFHFAANLARARL